jgi:integrase
MCKTSIIILKNKDKANTGRICKMTFENGKVSRTSIGYNIPMTDWCNVSRRVKPTNIMHTTINKQISDILTYGSQNVADTNTDCLVTFMENKIRETYNAKRMKYSTYKKYLTIANAFRISMNSIDKKELYISDLINKETLEKLTQFLSVNLKDTSKTKGTVKNYLVVFTTYARKWNEECNGNLHYDFRFVYRNSKKVKVGHASYLTQVELESFKNYSPRGNKCMVPQTISKSVFLSQYYIGGIRISDALTLTIGQFKENGIEIRVKKTGETRLYPYSYELMTALTPLFKKEYEFAIQNLKIQSIQFKANLLESLIRSGINHKEFEISQLQNKIENLQNSTNHNHKRLAKDLSEIETIVKQSITQFFFNYVRTQENRFVFPFLDYCLFKNELNNPDDFSKEMVESIHKATAKFNSNLKVISRNLGLNKRITSHSPRHTIAFHLIEKQATTTMIQDVLGHKSLDTTQAYIGQRLPNNGIRVGMDLILRN